MIKIYVMSTCPDCTEVKLAAQNDPRFELVDIGAHVRNLKEFLQLRDTHPKFRVARERGLVGIPSFLLPDGSITFHAEDVALDLSAKEELEGPTCNVDGTGC